ncbi:MAG: substrate-binding domain-containing protein [Oscillospiraceae bacterium]|nr:substrate-binding domain-containing protein [Oscillospiraceae bacterium]
MKKGIAIVLVLCMCVALVAACSNGDSTPATDGNGAQGSGGGASVDSPGPERLGFWDRNYDYTQHPRFRFVYMVSGPGPLFDTWDTEFAMWAERLNMDYHGLWAPADGSNEEFLIQLETFIDMGMDGIIFDADDQIVWRVVEILEQHNIPWMGGMAQSRDLAHPYSVDGQHVPGRLLGSSVGFNNTAVGREMANAMIDWTLENRPNIPIERVGFIAYDFTLAPQLHERALGAEQIWAERFPQFGSFHASIAINPDNFFLLDAAAGDFGQETAIDLLTIFLSNPPPEARDIDFWMIQALISDQAMGAQIALENLGMVDDAIITSFGGIDVVANMWEQGLDTAWRVHLDAPPAIFVETVINTFWAFVAGLATHDTIHPEWRVVWDKGDTFELTNEIDPDLGVPRIATNPDGSAVILAERNFSSMALPLIHVNQDNFREILAWGDLYQFGPDATDEERRWPQFPMVYDIDLVDMNIAPWFVQTQWPRDWP